jgi:zinc protease
VGGSILPTREPFLYGLGFTATGGVQLPDLEGAVLREIERVREHGLTEDEVARAKRQLRARLVFDNDSVTNVAHQLGYFETVTGPGYYEELSSRLAAVTPAQVAEVAARRLAPDRRTVGWFRPQEPKG